MRKDVLDMTAGDIAAAIRDRKIKAIDVVATVLARIKEVNPAVNAICTLSDDPLKRAAECDRRLAAGGTARLMEGVPFVVKDVLETKGLRTTFGSRLREDYLPEEDAVSVERMQEAGGILIGKTNTPEFATDSNTWNPLFGMTRNPWDLNTTPGGSSGGTAAALAAGMAPVGLGTDLGGSARTPASFCGIVGMRPSPGRIPVYPDEYGWDLLVPHVIGPMARTVDDIGRLLSVLSGPDERDPRSLPRPEHDYVAAANGGGGVKGRRIAYTADMNGLVLVDPEVARITRDACKDFERLGCTIEEACFDTSLVREIISGTRAFAMIARHFDQYHNSKDLMTTKLARQVEESLKIDIVKATRAEKLRTAYWHGVRRLLQQFDYLVMPTKSVTAFRLDQSMPDRIGNVRVERFFDSLIVTYAISITGLPAITVPCGLDSKGLPVGLQIVGRRMREDLVLEAAAAYAGLHPEHFARPNIDLSSVKPIADPLDFPSLRI